MQAPRAPGIENCLVAKKKVLLITHSQCCPPLHCPQLLHHQSAKRNLKFRANFDLHLRGYEWCGDAEVEREEEGEDGEQGVQVQHGHHLILTQACLPVKQERSYSF